MADDIDLKVLVKHIVDGTLEESLCRVCLKPLGHRCENIFTKVCKENLEFCIADVLMDLCNEQFSETDSYNVCSDCFLMATTAYKFFLMERRSKEYLQFYLEELTKNVDSIEIPENITNDTLCITLPKYTPTVKNIHFGIMFCVNDDYYTEFPEAEQIKKEDNNEKLIVLVEENGVQIMYEITDDFPKEKIKYEYKKDDEIAKSKTRRKRTAMEYRNCSQCPVKYRFFAKLKLHMKEAHNIDLFLCKVCKETVEGETWFDRHINTHTDIHRCNICNTVFKKRDTIIAHLQWHAEMKEMSNMDGAHVCEICGFILPNEEHLKEHWDQKHEKKYTCHYCGKMYRGELSCQAHVLKHERHLTKEKLENEIDLPKEKKVTRRKNSKSKSSPICATCGKSFVDERALMWHLMLHTNERPYTCDICGRGFISLNRRNQHVLCAHTMPTKRCPLCPSLFHLRSMVNSHIKKVHLKAHKRRNRSSKHRKVHWKTETVPIQELSVDIQNEILEIQTNLPDDKEMLPLSAIDENDPVFDDNWEISNATQRDVTQF